MFTHLPNVVEVLTIWKYVLRIFKFPTLEHQIDSSKSMLWANYYRLFVKEIVLIENIRDNYSSHEGDNNL